MKAYFLNKIRKNIVSLSSTELAPRVVKVKMEYGNYLDDYNPEILILSTKWMELNRCLEGKNQ